MTHQTRLRFGLLLLGGMALAAYPYVTGVAASAQGGGQAAAGDRLLNEPAHPALQGFRWRSIGPTGQGGRIHAIEAVESDTKTFFLGFATGGLWKTSNRGVTYDLVFPVQDDHHTHSIGALALAPSNPNILYVGTGEACNRQSSSFGTGVYKSTDGGTTFTHLGLRETQSIARIVVHPRNPDMAWVAAVGNLFGSNAERGLFMTTDGGKTWNKTLYLDEHTGVTDVVVDRSNPNILLAATYQRQRSAWGFIGGGPGSGIHQSSDGGRTWRRLSGNGLPAGVMGRIGLAMSRSNPNVVYAQIEVAPTEAVPGAAPPAPLAGRGGGGAGGRGGGQPPDPTRSGVWRSADKGKTWTFMSNENNRPMYYSHILVDPSDENTVYVGGLNAQQSTDGGKTWRNLHGGGGGRNMGHVDNHAIWVDPNDRRHIMYGSDGGLAVSWDFGDAWEAQRLWAVGQSYHVSVDMQRPYRVCTGFQDNGSWCGPSSKRSGTIWMFDWNGMGGGDGFQTAIDPTDPKVIYSESQNGNLRRYDLNVDGGAANIRPAAGGGRGGGGRGGGNIVPAPPPDTQINYNWNSPFRISPHNPRKVLYGGNRFFVSLDRGDTWRMSEPLGKNFNASERSMMGIAYNLPSCGRGGGAPGPCIPSRGDGVQGNEAATIIEIAESPLVPGIYWVGTADGNVQVSQDEGYTWTEVGRNVPGGTREYWVSGLEASWFDAGTAYMSLDGHHQNDLNPYVFKTTDYGRTWTNITGDLPWGHVNSIRQDPVNRNLLYAAHEFGFFISLNEGGQWHRFMPNLPTVRVDEVVVHPRDNDLVLGTHGRSVWIMDDITALQQMTPESLQQEATLFQPRDAVAWKSDPRDSTTTPGYKWWTGETAPRGTAIAYYLRNAASGEARITITNVATGEAVRTCTGTTTAGLNRFQWALSGDPQPGGGGGRGRGGRGAEPPPAPTGPPPITPCTAGGGGGGRGGGGGGGIDPGLYRVTLSLSGREVGSQTFSVLEDIWMR